MKIKRNSLRKRYKFSKETKDSGMADFGIMDWSKVGDEVEFFNPKEGRNKIIIVPYIIKTRKHPLVAQGIAEIGDLDYVMDVWEHRRIGPSESTVVCLKRTYGKPCPICEKAEEYKNLGKQEEYEALRPTRRVYYNVIDVKDPDRKLKVFATSHYLFERELIDEANAEDEEDFINFADIGKDGKIISFRASKTKKGGFEFLEFKSFKFLDRDEELDEDIIEEAISFDEIMRVYDYDAIENIFYGENGDKGESEEEEDEIDDEDNEKESKNVEKNEEEVVDEEDELGDDELEEKIPKKKPKKEKEKKGDDEDELKCPYGHVFGKDVDEYEECDNCPLWEKCSEANIQ